MSILNWRIGGSNS